MAEKQAALGIDPTCSKTQTTSDGEETHIVHSPGVLFLDLRLQLAAGLAFVTGIGHTQPPKHLGGLVWCSGT